jgi:hypothetical protein
MIIWIYSASPSTAKQDAEKVRQRKKTVIWFVWSVSFVLLNETNQMNQTDQNNEIDQIYRPWLRGRKMFLNT